MCGITDDICNRLVDALRNKEYAPGKLVELTRGVFSGHHVAQLEAGLQPILTSAAILYSDGYTNSGYREHAVDLGAFGGAVLEELDTAMLKLSRDLESLPRYAAA